MKKGFIFILLLFIMISSVAHANHDKEGDDWEALNHIADHALQLGKQEKFEEAKRVLENFSDLFLKQTSKHELTMKDLKMIIYSYEQAEEAVTQVKMNLDERINKLTQFRLAVDALSSEHQPLWKDAKRIVMTPLQQAVSSLSASEGDQFQFYLNDFFGKYEMIRPALVIDLSQEEMERIKSYIRFLENERSSFIHDEKKRKQLAEIEQAFADLFDNTKKDTTPAGLFEVIYIIGGVIVITLIYVGWRKYKGQKAEENKRERDRN